MYFVLPRLDNIKHGIVKRHAVVGGLFLIIWLLLTLNKPLCYGHKQN